MNNFQIHYNDDGTGNGGGKWTGEYDDIKITDNVDDPKLKDVKVYIDDELVLELFGDSINAINYDHQTDDILEDDNEDQITIIFSRVLPWLIAIIFIGLFLTK